MSASLERKLGQILAKADIEIDGNRSWDIKVNERRFFRRFLSEGSLGLGESYMDGWWDCDDLEGMIFRIIHSNLVAELDVRKRPSLAWFALQAKLMNMQSLARAFEVGIKHYDLGNDLFKAMLDKRMVYTCAYWKEADNLDDAQLAKLDLVCKKLGLKSGQRILDIGCGWGGLLKHAAEEYGASGVGVTVSKEQAEYAREVCKGLPIEIRLADYRTVDEKFDHIASICMIESVGYKNLRTYMEVVRRCLKGDGLFLLQAIGMNTAQTEGDPWFNKYIFPNAMNPSPAQLTKAFEGLLVLEDWHCFADDYYRTVMAWHQNFIEHWPQLKDKYGERFFRMWHYYLQAGAAGFHGRLTVLWQIVLSVRGFPEGYVSIR